MSDNTCKPTPYRQHDQVYTPKAGIFTPRAGVITPRSSSFTAKASPYTEASYCPVLLQEDGEVILLQTGANIKL